MEIIVNGTPADLNPEELSLGQILGDLDGRLEAAGGIIVSIKLDGTPIDADTLPSIADRPGNGPGRLEISAESSTTMRASAIRTLLELIDAAAKADAANLPAVVKTWDRYRNVFDGLYAAEEASFLDAFAAELEAGPAGLPIAAAKITFFFNERLTELEDPAGSMQTAARIFENLRPELAEVSVRMQTGKDSDAIKTMMVTVELINKAVRLLPEFSRAVPGAADFSVDGKNVGEFFDGFNDILRELAGAFESRDGVLIGDLAEYEILPRLDLFFKAATGALTSS
ncbi:MAG: hypothetical protein E4H20_05630 [Spirochaetales bacterium]|nr:MAG: hypothetical protein E4H20_05630 [Spirochaetales bacterium]